MQIRERIIPQGISLMPLFTLIIQSFLLFLGLSAQSYSSYHCHLSYHKIFSHKVILPSYLSSHFAHFSILFTITPISSSNLSYPSVLWCNLALPLGLSSIFLIYYFCLSCSASHLYNTSPSIFGHQPVTPACWAIQGRKSATLV